MATLTIRNLDDGLKQRLRLRAARHGRSMEDEAREIMRTALATAATDCGTDLGTAIHRLFAPLGGVELELPPRGPGRPLPTFDE